MPNPFTDATSTADWRKWQEDEGLIQRNPKPGVSSILSGPSKMPCPSFGLPAYLSHMGGKEMVTCPGSVLSRDRDENGNPLYPKAICWLCYAAKGRYLYKNVRNTMVGRLRLAASKDFVNVMIDAIREIHTGGPYHLSRIKPDVRKGYDHSVFRVHHSGDFFSVPYLRKWIRICERFPGVRFWIPSRTWVIRKFLEPLRELARLPNVIVRPSTIEFDTVKGKGIRGLPFVRGLHAPTGAYLHREKLTWGDKAVLTAKGKPSQRTMTATPGTEKAILDRGYFICPVTTGKGSCNTSKGLNGRKPCRACWTRDTVVFYRQH